VERSDVLILGVAGSLRRGSVNRRSLTAAARLVRAPHVVDRYEHLGSLPHFDEDLESGPEPPAVADLRSAVDAADAVLIATPEYNGSMPGPLKNALDWTSRPHGRGVLIGKPVAVVSASPSRFGAIRAQADARRVLSAIGAYVLDRELAVPRAFDAFTDDGQLADLALRTRFEEVLDELVRLAADLDTAPDLLASP
jgi:chromate reductase, NAD(P)H dehydrogenase (quinone)